jgi:AraC-like DNA-binding protein
VPLETGTIASTLGTWTFARYTPRASSLLSATLASAWYFDGVLAHARERVFPKGRHGLMLQLDEPHRDAGGNRYAPVVYNGLQTQAIVVEAPRSRVRVIGLEFTPAGGFAIAGRAARESVDRTIDLTDFRVECEALLDACRRAGGPAQTLLTAVRFCAERAAQTDACEPSVSAGVAQIDAARGNVRLRDLASRIGRSERALERAFVARVGVAPKRYARIARFDHAHELLVAGDDDLASIAERAGYYDQAHFNADFREHAGLSPTRYLASTRYPASRSLVEPTDPRNEAKRLDCGGVHRV